MRLRPYRYRIGYLQRLPLKLPYPAVVTAICAVMDRLPKGTTLLVDNTGIGRAIFDMLVHAGRSPFGVSISGGDLVHWETGQRRVSVPKATLVSKLVALVQSGNLTVHGDLHEWPALKHEMEIYRPEVTPSGRETWNAAGSGHDDLLTAAALCAWYMQADDRSGHAYYELARRQAAALGHRDTQPEEFVCAVDIGQSNDRTALCVMSKLDNVDDPDRDGFFERVAGIAEEPHLPGNPESDVDGAAYVGSAEWFGHQDEQQKRATAEGKTLSGPLAVGFVPAAQPYRMARPQPGSLLWTEIERENARFAIVLNGAAPTAAETAEHESNLQQIREAQHAAR